MTRGIGTDDVALGAPNRREGSVKWWLATLTFFACQREEEARPPPPPPPPPIPVVVDAATIGDPCAISIHMSRDAIAIGTPSGGCSGPHDDFAWLEGQLHRLHLIDADDPRSIDCGTGIELAADTGVLYQGVIHAMDVAIQAGFLDVGLTDPAGLAIHLDHPATLPRDCPKRVASGPRPPAPAGTRTRPQPPARLDDALVIQVSKQAIFVRNIEVMSVEAALAAGDKLEPLAKALPARNGKIAILQVDKDTDAGVISRIMATVKAAGYDDVMFAAKNR
jgi:biopolymer transport protein ExbD